MSAVSDRTINLFLSYKRSKCDQVPPKKTRRLSLGFEVGSYCTSSSIPKGDGTMSFFQQLSAPKGIVQAPWLRIIHINEASQLTSEELAVLGSLVKHTESGEKSKRPHRTIVCLNGNFLGPNILSCLDQGGLCAVDVFNQIGVTHACFGTFEANALSSSVLGKRIDQSKFRWLNTNATGSINDYLSTKTAHECDVVKVSNGRISKRVALTSFLSGDPSFYSPGGVCGISPPEPPAESMLEQMDELKMGVRGSVPRSRSGKQKVRKVDLIIPITFQATTDNLLMASALANQDKNSVQLTPIILCGGPDAISSQVTEDGIQLVQPPPHSVALIDIVWKPGRPKPSIVLQMMPLSGRSISVDPRMDVLERVSAYERVFMQRFTQSKTTDTAPSQVLFHAERWARYPRLRKALCIPDAVTPLFTTAGNEDRMSLGMSALATMMRLGWSGVSSVSRHLKLSAVLLPADAVLGKSSYSGWFSWNDLRNEIPASPFMVTADIPGRVLQDAITYSRSQGNAASFLHACTNVEFQGANDAIVKAISGEPLDPDLEYLVALPISLFHKKSGQMPLVLWAKQNSSSVLKKEAAQRADHLIIRGNAATLWFHPGGLLEFISQEPVSRERTSQAVRERISRRKGSNLLLQEGDVIDSITEHLFSFFEENDEGDVDMNLISPLNVLLADPIVQDSGFLIARSNGRRSASNANELDSVLSDFLVAVMKLPKDSPRMRDLGKMFWNSDIQNSVAGLSSVNLSDPTEGVSLRAAPRPKPNRRRMQPVVVTDGEGETTAPLLSRMRR